MDNLSKKNKIVLSCFFFKIAKGLDHTVLIGLCGPTPVLAVHGINKKFGSLSLKKPIFIPVSGFHSPISRSGPILKTMVLSVHINLLWRSKLS